MNANRLTPTKAAWSVGVSSAAAIFLLLGGVFQALQGLAAILKGEFFVVGADYTFTFDTTTWGWIHVILGLVAVITGIGLFGVAGWAQTLGIVIAVLGAVSNFLWLPYQPGWSIIMIVVYSVVIWALSNYDRATQ